jgi:aminoglycoside phosphotransferase (APT) family kinase protein
LRALDPPAVARMLEPIFGACSIASLEPLTGGLVNTNYRVRLAGRAEPVVLRVYADPEACPRDAALLRLVRDRVPVPEILLADSSGERCDRPYAVMSWIEGVPLEEAMRSDPTGAPLVVGRAAGETLAAIGSHAFTQSGFFGADLVPHEPSGETAEMATFPGYIESCFAAPGVAGRLGEPLATRLQELVRQSAAYLPDWQEPAVLVHADYKSGNILVHPDGDRWRVAGVLDWEFAFAGPHLYDFTMLLRYSDELPPGFERGVAEGYTAAGGALPPDWKRCVRLLDFVNLLFFLRRPSPDPARDRDVRRLLTRTLRDWDRYG